MSRRKVKTSFKQQVFGVILAIVGGLIAYWLVTGSWDILDWMIAGFR